MIAAILILSNSCTHLKINLLRLFIEPFMCFAVKRAAVLNKIGPKGKALQWLHFIVDINRHDV
jgi:hypothetical protein